MFRYTPYLLLVALSASSFFSCGALSGDDLTSPLLSDDLASLKETSQACPVSLNFRMKRLSEEEEELCTYSGKAILIVNTASECGFVGQYGELQKIYKDYEKDGFVILGFPSNDFMGQEPLKNNEIEGFCRENYGVEFPMFQKIQVDAGKGQSPLYTYLTKNQKDKRFHGDINWNFEKFLISQSGEVVGRFSPSTDPDIIRPILDKLLR